MYGDYERIRQFRVWSLFFGPWVSGLIVGQLVAVVLENYFQKLPVCHVINHFALAVNPPRKITTDNGLTLDGFLFGPGDGINLGSRSFWEEAALLQAGNPAQKAPAFFAHACSSTKPPIRLPSLLDPMAPYPYT